MKWRKTTAYFVACILLAGLAAIGAKSQTITEPFKAVQLTGLTGVKNNAKGTLKVENGQLHFVHGKESSDVSTSTMEDVVTGADTQRAVGGTIGTLSMAAPYGSGRFLSLFRKKIDTLTLQYRDSDGGLHGVIFTLPVGASELLKKELVAQGARTTVKVEQSAIPTTSTNSQDKEKN